MFILAACMSLSTRAASVFADCAGAQGVMLITGAGELAKVSAGR